MSTQSPVSVSPLKFGIEIECYLPRAFVESEQFTVGGYHRGIQIKGAPDGWKAEHDGSVSGHAPSGYVGLEIVSPVLCGDDGLAQVVGFFDFLKEIKAKVNKYTGMHVHVDASNLSSTQVGFVQQAFRHHEAAFYGLNGKHYTERLRNPYCVPSDLWDGQGRYCSLNIMNYLSGRKPTVECRVWRATVEAEVAVAAVVMMTSLVAKVRAGHHDTAHYTGRVECPREASQAFTQAYLSGGYSMVDDMAFNDEVSHIIVGQAARAA